jgi:CelD/BcsL family acetyltransferase involved in cellulose biosynthesis
VGDFSIETHRTVGAIEEEWDALGERVSAPPFMRPGWIGPWWQAFGRGELEIFAARADGRLECVLPLARRALSLRSPTNWHSPMFGPVNGDRAAVAELAQAVVGDRGHWLDMSLLDAEDPLLEELLRTAHATDAHVIARPVLSSPYMELRGTAAEWEAGMSRNFRSNLARRRRQLERDGKLEVYFTDGSDRLDELLDEGFRIEGSGWKDSAGTAITSDPTIERFYRKVAHWAAARGWLRLGFLRLDGRCVAFDLSLAQGGSLYALKGGFDPRYRTFAPGMLMLAQTIAHAFEDGMTTFEFLGGPDPYKLRFTDTLRTRMRVQAFPATAPATAAYLAWTYARPLAKRGRDLLGVRRARGQADLKPARDHADAQRR